MTIAFDITSLKYGRPPHDGMANYLYQSMSLLLAKNDVHVIGIGLATSNRIFAHKNYSFIDVSEYFTTNELNYEQYYYYLNFILPMVLKKTRVDIIHGTDNFNIPLDTTETKKILTVHDTALIEEKYIQTSKRSLVFYKTYTEQAVAAADSIITDSEFSKKRILHYFISSISHKLSVIEPAIYLFHGTKRKKAEYPYVLCSTGINYRKNTSGVIESYNKSGIFLFGVKLVITGTFDIQNDYTRQLCEQIVTAGLEDYVIFTGLLSRDEYLWYLHNASIGISLSFYEGYGLFIAESQSVGLPIICSNNTASVETVQKNGGTIVDPQDMTHAANELCNLWKKVSRSGYGRKISKDYEKQNRNYTQRLLGVYNSVLSE